jgi:hypothetical protein
MSTKSLIHKGSCMVQCYSGAAKSLIHKAAGPIFGFPAPSYATPGFGSSAQGDPP